MSKALCMSLWVSSGNLNQTQGRQIRVSTTMGQILKYYDFAPLCICLTN